MIPLTSLWGHYGPDRTWPYSRLQCGLRFSRLFSPVPAFPLAFQIPFNGTADPFVEFSEFGFRGFPAEGERGKILARDNTAAAVRSEVARENTGVAVRGKPPGSLLSAIAALPLHAGQWLSDAVEAVCSRTCAWFRSLTAEQSAFFIQQNDIFRARLAAGEAAASWSALPRLHACICLVYHASTRHSFSPLPCFRCPTCLHVSPIPPLAHP